MKGNRMDMRDLVNKLCVKCDCTRAEATRFVKSFLGVVKEELNTEKDFRLTGVGTLRLKEKPPRKVWSNLTKNYVDVGRRFRLTVRTSPAFAKELAAQPETKAQAVQAQAPTQPSS